MVASTGPGRPVRGSEQRVELMLHEVGHQRGLGALGGDGQHPGDEIGVLGMAQGGMLEQGVDRRQAGVAGPGGVVPLLLQHGQEIGHQFGVHDGKVEVTGVDAGALVDVANQQPERVAVGGDGVAAGGSLADEVVGKERLQGGGKRAHGRWHCR